LLPTLDI